MFGAWLPALLTLLAVNAVLLAALAGLFGDWLGEAREPARLTRQVRPDRLRLSLPRAAGPEAGAESDAGVSPTPGVIAAPAEADAQRQPMPTTAATDERASGADAANPLSAAAPGVCAELAPLHSSQLPPLRTSIERLGLVGLAWQEFLLPAQTWHWVHMGPYSDREQVIRKGRELQRRGIAWRELVPAANLPRGLAPGLDLGHFLLTEEAHRALQDLRRRGARSAEVDSPASPEGLLRIRLSALDARQWPALQTQVTVANASWELCPGTTLPDIAQVRASANAESDRSR